MTDAQWKLIEDLAGRPDPRGAKPVYERRDIINAILYVNKTGCQWRMLPAHFPHGKMSTINTAAWSCGGHGRRFVAGSTKSPEKEGLDKTSSYLLFDSQSVKSNGEGEERGFHGGKKTKDRSRQVATDTLGNVWAVHCHAANKSDTVEGCVLANMVFTALSAVKAVCADQGYRGTFVTHVNDEWGRDVHISGRQGNGFEVEPMRWVVERTFAWFSGQQIVPSVQ